MAKFAPLLVAAGLLAGVLIVAAPAQAAPCYQQGQPAPPAPPNPALASEKCQAALNAWLTVLFVGAGGGRTAYGVITFADRVVSDTMGGTTAQGYANCLAGSSGNVFACSTNPTSLYRCNQETGATITCGSTWALRTAGSVDKLVANAPWVCLATVSSFAPSPPSGLPAAPPSPGLVCLVTMSPPPASPPAPLTWPPTLRPIVDAVLP